MSVVTPIYLDENESKKFLMFMQNYDAFSKVIQSGVLDIRSGSFVTHLDSQGIVRLIEKNTTMKF